MITDKDVEKLKEAFATTQDYAHLEDKVDKLAETVNGLVETVSALPTKTDIENMLERMYNLSVLKAEHDRIKTVIREQ
jgi:hypothetical protein